MSSPSLDQVEHILYFLLRAYPFTRVKWDTLRGSAPAGRFDLRGHFAVLEHYAQAVTASLAVLPLTYYEKRCATSSEQKCYAEAYSDILDTG